ncbi:MAG: hypothetical protein ACLQDM_00685 [Bradyrhizobium sp.]
MGTHTILVAGYCFRAIPIPIAMRHSQRDRRRESRFSDGANCCIAKIEHAAGISEVDLLELEMVPNRTVKSPPIADAPISLKRVLHDVTEFGELKSQLFIGREMMFHIRDELFSDGKIETTALRPIAGFGGPH